jgi:hypothetical protein
VAEAKFTQGRGVVNDSCQMEEGLWDDLNGGFHTSRKERQTTENRECRQLHLAVVDRM